MEVVISALTSPCFLLFDSKASNRFCILNEYIKLLKCSKLSTPLNFSFISEESSLIDNISINENILLQVPQNSDSISSEDFESLMARQKNKFIAKLLELIPNLHWIPEHLNEEGKKVISIVNAILKNSPTIFIHGPETHLTSETLEIFKNALQFEAETNNKTVVLSTIHTNIWDGLINKTIQKTHNNSYQLVPYKKNMAEVTELFAKKDSRVEKKKQAA